MFPLARNNLYASHRLSEDTGQRRNVKISPEAGEVLDALVDETGMKQWVILDRVLTWMKGQPDEVKREFVVPAGDPAGAMVRIRDAKMLAAGDTTPVTLEQAAKQIKSLSDQILVMEKAYRPLIEQAVKNAGKQK
jgi:hypothetical protein